MAEAQRFNALLKTVLELVREQTSTQWNKKGARKIDNLLAESIKAHGGKLMDVSETLLEKNPVGKLDLIDLHGTDLYCHRKEIGTNI